MTVTSTTAAIVTIDDSLNNSLLVRFLNFCIFCSQLIKQLAVNARFISNVFSSGAFDAWSCCKKFLSAAQVWRGFFNIVGKMWTQLCCLYWKLLSILATAYCRRRLRQWLFHMVFLIAINLSMTPPCMLVQQRIVFSKFCLPRWVFPAESFAAESFAAESFAAESFAAEAAINV